MSRRQLNAFYRVKRFIPRPLQLEARRLVVRWQGVPEFPQWPFDGSVARLLRFYAFASCLHREGRRLRFDGSGRTDTAWRSFSPTTSRGRKVCAWRSSLPTSRSGSSFNLGAWYPVDQGALRELTSRGFEIGVHGIRHDRSLFASRQSFDDHQAPLRELSDRLSADSFRSPATHRVVDWIGELPFDCDRSIPHSDPFEPQPGGCCAVWPFFIGRVVELPYTMPQDHTLFTLLRHRTPKLWLE